LLTFFTCCYLLLLFLTACNFYKLLSIVESSLFVTFLLLVSFKNYLLLLRGAIGIVLLYLFIVQGEGVRLDFIFLISFILERGGGVQVNVFFFSSFIWHVGGRGFRGFFFFLKLFFHCWVAREGGQGFFLKYICWRGMGGRGGWVFFIVEREGVEVNVFFFSFIWHVQGGGEMG